MPIYRVVLKVGYYERWFEFSSALDASNFAMIILNHAVISEDHKKLPTEVMMKVVNKVREENEKEEDEDE